VQCIRLILEILSIFLCIKIQYYRFLHKSLLDAFSWQQPKNILLIYLSQNRLHNNWLCFSWLQPHNILHIYLSQKSLRKNWLCFTFFSVGWAGFLPMQLCYNYLIQHGQTSCPSYRLKPKLALFSRPGVVENEAGFEPANKLVLSISRRIDGLNMEFSCFVLTLHF